MDRNVVRFAALLGLPARKALAAKPKAANSNKAPRSAAPKPRPAATPAKRPLKAPARKAERSSELNGRLKDRADTRRVDVACDYCEASGVYGGKPCPMCDGEGLHTLEKSSDLADSISNAGDRGRSPPTLPQSAAKSTKALAALSPETAAARIITAGKMRRGEIK